MRFTLSVALAAMCLACSCGSPAPGGPVTTGGEAKPAGQPKADARGKPAANAHVSYQERKKTFKTKLRVKGPAPQEYEKEQPPEGVREVSYTSGPYALKAWWALPEKAQQGKVPAFVFLHGGFAFGGGDFEVCSLFADAGFAVMTPWFRGENGNPGHHELFLGEADDAHAALEWVAAQPEVDASHIYVFGHSAGGALASLMSLYAGPARLTGSAGGLYDQEGFLAFGPDVPFDARSQEECRMRSLKDNLADMRVPHIAYVGKADTYAMRAAQRAKKRADELKKPLQVIQLPGDHFTSFDLALAEFLKAVLEDVQK